jgi:hypothetical protein
MLNTTQEERKQSARKDLRLKLALEFQLIRVLNQIFREASLELERYYAVHGIVPRLVEFSDDLKTALLDHYDNVADKFNTRIVDEIGIPDNHERILSELDNKIALYNDANADQSVRSITATTQKNMQAAIDKVQKQAAEEDKRLNREETAKQARLGFDQRSVGHKNTIATTETQGAAEHAKQSEIEMLDRHDAIIAGVSIRDATKQKVWIAILDNVTRDAHAIADGQTVAFNEPYTVMGEQLMYPRDTSLGASADNIINCRCDSVPVIIASSD